MRPFTVGRTDEVALVRSLIVLDRGALLARLSRVVRYGLDETCVEATTHTYRNYATVKADEVLRGYAWLALVPAPLVPKVGGMVGLQGSGVFFSAREFPNGAVLLRATEHFRDFRDPDAARVFEVLRAALPPGTKPSAFRRHFDYLTVRGDIA